VAPNDTPPPFELFHAISDPSSARVRRYVQEHDLQEVVRFRNVTYPEVVADLTARGGQDAPALWDGQRLHNGADAVIARLEAHRDVGRA
jgi:hypothetical protein